MVNWIKLFFLSAFIQIKRYIWIKKKLKKPIVFIVILKGSHSSSKWCKVYQHWLVIDWYRTLSGLSQWHSSVGVLAFMREPAVKLMCQSSPELYISQLSTNFQKDATLFEEEWEPFKMTIKTSGLTNNLANNGLNK